MAPDVVVVLAVPLVNVAFPDADKVVMVVFAATREPAVDKLPAVTCPATPRPPERTSDPELVVVLAVALVKVVIPPTDKVPVSVAFPELSMLVVKLFVVI